MLTSTQADNAAAMQAAVMSCVCAAELLPVRQGGAPVGAAHSLTYRSCGRLPHTPSPAVYGSCCLQVSNIRVLDNGIVVSTAV
jgi:hypothetical protein